VVFWQGFVVVCVPSVFADPGGRPFDDPSVWRGLDVGEIVGVFDHFDRQGQYFPGGRDELPGVAVPGPGQDDGGEAFPWRDEQVQTAVVVPGSGCRDGRSQ
jgi:hypothetical protein